jgi:hypothetical protein
MKRLALEQLHDQEAAAVVPPDVEERADVRVIQRGDGTGLALEAGLRQRIAGSAGRKDLDRDVPVEPGVPAAVHLPHATRTEDGRFSYGPSRRP